MLDLNGISSLADAFVIATGNNPNQLKAMAENVEDELSKKGIFVHHREGMQSGEWILLDFNGVIVHIFHKDKREFYDLDRIWADAEVLIL